MIEFIPHTISAIALLISIAGLFAVCTCRKDHKKQLEQQIWLQNKLFSLEDCVAKLAHSKPDSNLELQKEQIEMRASLIAMANQMVQLEQQVVELSQNQLAPEELDPERRMYRRAIRMIELGADLEEIIQECELPKAEAELLLNIHQKKPPTTT